MVYVEYNGKRFVKDVKYGYYHAHFGNTTKMLHRVIWEDNFGAIPEGFHVHHKDGNKDNNTIDNLELVDAYSHLSLHGKKKKLSKEHLNKLIEASKEWHSSDEGLLWHSNHMKNIIANLPYVTKRCDFCCAEYRVKSAYSNKSRFCSNRCKSAYRRKHKLDHVENICPVCGSIFRTDKYDPRRTCSLECRRIYFANSGNKEDT